MARRIKLDYQNPHKTALVYGGYKIIFRRCVNCRNLESNVIMIIYGDWKGRSGRD
jgi:hypothetical protein